VEIVPPDESFAGATLGEWGARWWQWTHSFPADINPNFDTTGARCGYGQSGPVFSLPIGVEGATLSPCVVAEGTAIYVIVSAIQCSNVEGPPFFGADEDGLRACVEAHPASSPSTSFHANVNGHEVADLDAYRIVTPLFTLTLGEDNDLGVEPGVAQAMSLDYGFLIAPPPPGEYVIDVSSTIEGQPGVEYTINVTVEAPLVIEPVVSAVGAHRGQSASRQRLS
jgi:hypothetical protein